MMYFNRLLLVLLCFTLWSCSNDDDNTTTDNNILIGKWLRSDYDSTYEHSIHFEDNDFGYTADKHTTAEGIVSTAISFDWSVSNNKITLVFDSHTIISNYSFTENGNLIINDLSTLEFIKQ